MKKLITLSILATLLSSCNNDKVTITKEEYKQLKGDTVKPKYSKIITILNPYSGNPEVYYIVLGSDTHNYLTNDGYAKADWKILIHYPDCEKCLLRNKKDSL